MDYFVKAYKDWKLHSQFQEIVPDMDDEYMFNEKQSIRESARSLKKYGSTCCNHIRNNETLIKHEIQKTDTLQGIALKYGCTTEQIRRANRLFASDSLFLRQYLLVPVEKTSPYYPTTTIKEENNSVDSSEATTPTTTPTSPPPLSSVDTTRTTTMSTSASAAEIASTAHTATTSSSSSPRPSSNLPTRPYSIAGDLLVQTHDDENVLSNHHHNNNNSGCNNNSSSSSSNNNKQSKSLDSVVVAMTPEEENRKYINEFLSKIDTTISESRKYVEKSKEMIATTQGDDDVFVITDIVERKRNNHLNNSYKNDKQNHQNHVRQSSTGSTSDTAQLLNTTQTRRVQNSLKRLEKQQDEFFEL